MTVAVAMPWMDGTDCEHRIIARVFAIRYWAALFPDAEIVIEHGPNPFSRGSALNAAIEKTAADIVIACDSDSLVPPGQIRAAVELAEASDGLVLPFDRYRYLNASQTASCLDVAHAAWLDDLPFEVGEVCGDGGSGNVGVFSRATWWNAGCFDEGFSGSWGSDDACFAIATEALVAPVRRVAGEMRHLWHPVQEQSRPAHPVCVESVATVTSYREAAAAGEDAVRALSSERRRP